jgi:TonB family protein
MSTDVLNQRFLFVPRPALVASLVLHVAIPFAYLVYSGLKSLGIELFPKDRKPVITDYQNYIQVDVVALPDQLVSQQFSVDTSKPIVEKVAKAPEVVENPKTDMALPDATKPKEDALAELKKREQQKLEDEKKLREEKEKALKNLKRETEREAALKALEAKDGKQGRQVLKGNKLAKGTATSGAIGAAKDAYAAQLKRRVTENYFVMPGMERKGLVTVVQITLLASGRLKEKKILKKSRDPIHDAAVLQAVEAAQPYPLPENPELLELEYTLEFRPEAK